MKKVIIIIMLLLLLILKSCQKQKEILKFDTFSKNFIGQWERITNGVPVYEYLQINRDKSFMLKGHGEMSEIFSRGFYKVDSPYIILKSDKIDSCFYEVEFRNTVEIVNLNDSSEESVKVVTTIKGCKPKDISKHYIIFSNDSFYLKRDTLFYVLQDKRLPISLFSFVRLKDTLK